MSIYPPLRYCQITPSIHRGSYPRPVNFPFLKRLQLKTVLSLTPQPITQESDPLLHKFLTEQGIRMIHVPMAKESKKKFQYPTNDEMLHVLKLVINSENSPIYIHCLNGGVVTSLLVACLRKVQLWNTIAIFREFSMFTDGVVSLKNRTFLEEFKIKLEQIYNQDVCWLWSGLSMDVVSRHPTLCSS